MVKLTLYGRPYTKKNSPRIICKPYPRLLPSKNYVQYEKDSLKQITGKHRKRLNGRYNLKAVYYMPTRHKVDLTNLLNATCDILVTAGTIEDDNSQIIAGHDGSRVKYDKENPRVEIEITELEKEDE